MRTLPHISGRDHPHIRSPKGVMSCDEIRYWIRELVDNHGWTFYSLARLFAYTWRNSPDAGAVRSKLRKSWVYPAEQPRLSRQLDRVISGELVLQGTHAVVADNPVPLQRPGRMAYDFQSGRLCWVTPRIGTGPLLPSFNDVFKDPDRWLE